MPPPPPSPSPDPDDPAWYGNIQYLLNISAAGAASCVLLFFLVKLRSDHRSFPGPSALLAKLLAVYHATAAQIALHCGADASQFLYIERASFRFLLAVSALALIFALPLNLAAPSSPSPSPDLFARTTVNHVPRASPLLWAHFLLMLAIVALAHLAIRAIEDDLRATRFRDAHADPAANSVAVFSIIVHGVPRALAADPAPLEGYFHHRYPGKVSRVVIPFDLCALDGLARRFRNVRDEISRLETRIGTAFLLGNDDAPVPSAAGPLRAAWSRIHANFGLSDASRLAKLRAERSDLAEKLLDYREGRAHGAGIGFVVFKDVFTANKAARDLRHERKHRPTGQFFPLMELQLERNRWRVEKAPPATDIYWNNVGSSKLSLQLRRVAVNSCLVLMLLFCSSPLAIITAVKTAARIINAEAVDHAQSWLTWLESSSWFAAVVLQFLPNVIIFVSMYVVIPSVLSYLSKFERHLTMSGEQRAALLKMVCFFLVNLIFLKAMVETSLENMILRMGRCYVDGEDCKKIEQYISGSFLTKSCLSALAFLITSTFLGISFDLLAPVPWIKKTLKKFQKNDMLQLVPEQSDEYPLEHNNGENALRMPLMSENESRAAMNGDDLQGQDLSTYPINRSFHVPKQTFDFAQYYAFNLTIFALTLIYSLLAPLVVPVGAAYFGYRYLVDKYNFLFVYRVHGFPAGNDGKLMDMVMYIMHFCVSLFLLSMMFFFSVQGDSLKLQAILTFILLVFYAVFPSKPEGFQPSLLEDLQTVDSFVDGPTDYEVFSQPIFDWNQYRM